MIRLLLSEETVAPQIETQIDTIFIDDNELFSRDELTDENKAFIKALLDKANYKDILDDNKDDQQKLIQDDLSVPIPTGDIKTEIIDDVVPPDPLFFPTENKIFDEIVPPPVPLVTPKTEFIPDLTPLQKTGIKSVDDNNHEDHLKLLQIYRPDLLCRHQRLKLLTMLYFHETQYLLFLRKLLNYQNQYPKLICLKTLTLFQQFLILIMLIMSMETLTLTLLNKHLIMTMT